MFLSRISKTYNSGVQSKLMSVENRKIRRKRSGTESSYSSQRREFSGVSNSRPSSTISDQPWMMVQPTPPPRPPSSQLSNRRPRIRPPSREHTRYNLYEQGDDSEKNIPGEEWRETYSRASTAALSRPSSSLSKYNPLPPIGHSREYKNTNDGGDAAESLQKLQLDVRIPSVHNRNGNSVTGESDKGDNPSRDHTRREQRVGSKTKPSIAGTRTQSFHYEMERGVDNTCIQDSSEMSKLKNATDKKDLFLALKLPDGQRFQQSFSQTSTLGSVLQFAQIQSGLNFDGFSLIQNSNPKRVFSDLSLTLSECGVDDKTLLYIDEDE